MCEPFAVRMPVEGKPRIREQVGASRSQEVKKIVPSYFAGSMVSARSDDLVRQRCMPQRRTVSRSSASKPRLSTSSPIRITLIRPAKTLSV